ncbi:DNA primase family protein [Arthrobacter celericrescens]|uniref:DNA primase family protein n=1 Tax=Arthrobacter celericrescens TaxID=2320851 RepID=UPI000EA3DF5D|nr:phage/plasmid primase, P4 family [Arthrobacter celericrescens]
MTDAAETEIPEWFRAEAFTDDMPGESPDLVFRGQLRIAYRLAAEHADKLMYVHGLGWHWWYGNRWVEDHTGRAAQRVYSVIRAAHAEAFRDDKLAADVRACQSANGVDGVLRLASKLEAFAFTHDDLDADAYLLNVANGTLDLRTMELRAHDPRDRITKVCRASYDPGAAGPVWDAFLRRSLPDEDVRAFLQRYIGQALAGRTMEHALAILTGTGRNGKGVWCGAVNKALGSYATSVRPDLLLARDGAHTTDEMDLMGVRWVTMSEIEQGRALAEATMKRLTGGDTIRARRMRQDSVAFEPSHTLAMVANHLPKTSGNDEAVWKRLKVVPFEVVIPAAEQDPRLDEKLGLELEAVLAWIVAGWQEYRRLGLADPDKVRARTAAYRDDSDGLALFIMDNCVTGDGANVPLDALWRAWERWANAAGFIRQAATKREFSKAMEARGFVQGKSGGSRTWKRIGLKTDMDEPLSGWG